MIHICTLCNHYLHILHQLELFSSKLSMSILRTAFLKLIRLGKFLILSLSFVHSIGPKYRRECLRYLMVLNLGKLKSLFRGAYVDCFWLKMSMRLFGASFSLYTYKLQCLVITDMNKPGSRIAVISVIKFWSSSPPSWYSRSSVLCGCIKNKLFK